MKKASLQGNLKAYLALLVVYIVWSTTFGAIFLASRTIPPALMVCLRFSIAGSLLILYALLKGETFPGFKAFRRDFIIGALLFFGGNSIVAWAVHYVPTGLGAMITATNPFWMVSLSALMPPKEKVHPLAMAGLLIGFVGIFILLLPHLNLMNHHALASTSPLFWPSIGALVVMVFFWALGSIYARKSFTTASLLMSVGIQNFSAGLLLIPFSFWTMGPSPWHASLTSILSLFYLIGFGSMMATPCYIYVLKALPVSVTSTFSYVTPVFTLILGWLVLGEDMSFMTALGAAIILFGVVLVQWAGQRQMKAVSLLEASQKADESSPIPLVPSRS